MGFMDGVPKVMDGLCHGKSQEIDDLCRGLRCQATTRWRRGHELQ